MLTRLKIRNFKQFEDVEIELGQTVVFIGANNSGKTTALQALMLWFMALQEWQQVLLPVPSEKEHIDKIPLNRLEILATPTPDLAYLWRNAQLDEKSLEISATYHVGEHEIQDTFTFTWDNSESLYCNRPKDIVSIFNNTYPNIVYLSSMSGLVSVEPKIERGRMAVLIGEGRTAEVLRNLCYNVYEKETYWQDLVDQMQRLFRIEILPPVYIVGRGEIRMSYRESNQIELDISSAGRGMLQILLLLAFIYDNPNTVLLLDEPDAHLEIIRQRQVYELLTTTTRQMGSQLMIATHSEIIMNEAGEQDTMIAFVGKPHRIDTRSHQGTTQIKKALAEIRFDDYVQAEQTGWVLYLEGTTDKSILQAFANKLNHSIKDILSQAFVVYISNQEKKAQNHFAGLQEAKPNIKGVVLFDRLKSKISSRDNLTFLIWRKREIENYLFMPEVLIAYAQSLGEKQAQTMTQLIEDRIPPIALRNRQDIWWANTKASDDFLEELFEAFFKTFNMANIMRKSNFHILADYVPVALIDPEVTEKLDEILKVAIR